MTSRKVPVLIVGAGPVGLALAGDLGWRGVPCCLVEKTDGSIYQPKMDMAGVRTMEFCRRWGIASWVDNSPYPRDYPSDNVWVESLAGFEFGRERMVSRSEEPCREARKSGNVAPRTCLILFFESLPTSSARSNFAIKRNWSISARAALVSLQNSGILLPADKTNCSRTILSVPTVRQPSFARN